MMRCDTTEICDKCAYNADCGTAFEGGRGGSGGDEGRQGR
jgi:hypothetical protein